MEHSKSTSRFAWWLGGLDAKRGFLSAFMNLCESQTLIRKRGSLAWAYLLFAQSFFTGNEDRREKRGRRDQGRKNCGERAFHLPKKKQKSFTYLIFSVFLICFINIPTSSYLKIFKFWWRGTVFLVEVLGLEIKIMQQDQIKNVRLVLFLNLFWM